MKKRFFVIALMFMLIVCSVSVGAASPLLDDSAGLLFDAEANRLSDKLDEISNEHNVDVVIVTVHSIDVKSARAYADDYYDTHGYGEDGILLLISMEYRDWWISTSGSCITAFTDAGLEYIEDIIVSYFSDESFYEGFMLFADLCDSFLTEASKGQPYDYENMPKEPYDIKTSIIVSLVIGIIVALIATGVMKGQLNTVRPQTRADDYVKDGSMRVTGSRDLYLYSHVDRRARPQNNGGSRGSSVRMSSSGRSHGGRGGRF